MIVANKTFTLSGTLLGGVVAIAITGLSFTSETSAQTTTLETAPPTLEPKAAATPDTGPSNIVYNPSVDRLDALFPTGVVATVANRSITVAEVRSYIAPLIPQLQRDTRTQEEFNGRLTLLQNSGVKDLVRPSEIRETLPQIDGIMLSSGEAHTLENAHRHLLVERVQARTPLARKPSTSAAE